jgi:hypothetical protein
MFVGPAAVEDHQAAAFEDVLREVVVVRGTDPLPVRDPIPLRLPRELVLPGDEPPGAAPNGALPAG